MGTASLMSQVEVRLQAAVRAWALPVRRAGMAAAAAAAGTAAAAATASRTLDQLAQCMAPTTSRSPLGAAAARGTTTARLPRVAPVAGW